MINISCWKVYKLGEVLILGNGKSRPLSDGSFPVYGGNGILGYCDRYNSNDEVIIIGRVGAYCGSVFYERRPIWISDNALSGKPNQNGDTKYFYYLLKNLNLNLLAEGSSHPLITQTLLNTIEIEIPPLPEQKAIAGVLSSLDDKIDLLHRQNKTLESLAETLFRQYFIKNAKDEPKKFYLLGELIETISNTHTFPSEKIVFLNTSDIHRGAVLKHEYDAINTLPGQAKKSIKREDILFSEIRPANGRYAYIDFDSKDYVVSTKLMVLRSKNIINQPFIYFYLTHPDTIEWLQMIAESRSGTFPQITFDNIKDLRVNIPSLDILLNSSVLCEDWLKKIKNNQKQIHSLEKLRDTLLPKLMNSEIIINTEEYKNGK